MPQTSPRPCCIPGCPALLPSGRCQAHQRAYDHQERERRGSAFARGYGKTWQRARVIWLAAHPICADPFGSHGVVIMPATVVDHIVPHHGDMKKFWRTGNVQSLCKRCHDRKTATEDGGFGREVVTR